MAILFEVPDGLVMPAANCMADFDSICNRLDVHPAVKYITYSKRLNKPKESYRTLGLKLNNNRLAVLIKMNDEDYFEIWLQRKGYGFYLSDVEEVCEFIQIQKDQVVRLDSGLKWIKPVDNSVIEIPIMTIEDSPETQRFLDNHAKRMKDIKELLKDAKTEAEVDAIRHRWAKRQT
jgi:hypothetical protein